MGVGTAAEQLALGKTGELRGETASAVHLGVSLCHQATAITPVLLLSSVCVVFLVISWKWRAEWHRLGASCVAERYPRAA